MRRINKPLVEKTLAIIQREGRLALGRFRDADGTCHCLLGAAWLANFGADITLHSNPYGLTDQASALELLAHGLGFPSTGHAYQLSDVGGFFGVVNYLRKVLE